MSCFNQGGISKNPHFWPKNSLFRPTPKNPKKGPKKGLFWGFLKYMVNRPTFLRLVVLGPIRVQKTSIFSTFFRFFDIFEKFLKNFYKKVKTLLKMNKMYKIKTITKVINNSIMNKTIIKKSIKIKI
jgi:hypothetical protein